jgi:putative queuosine salvage protein
VVERAADVGVAPLEQALDALAGRPLSGWAADVHYGGPSERTLRYLLVLDTVNFSFWGGAAGGYLELAARLRLVFEAGDELAEPAWFAEITAGRLRELLGDLPMLEDRAAALRELGRHGFDGLVQPTATGTAATLAGGLSSYRDVAAYGGREVPFLKRAQILPADLHGGGGAAFPDLGDLTCFPDYKLPQVLRHLGALRYSESLARRVDGLRELAPGEPAEVEIRAATVVCVERLRDALASSGRQLLAIEVDWLLWGLSQELSGMRPYHRVRTTAY